MGVEVASIGSPLALATASTAPIPVPAGVGVDDLVLLQLYVEANRTITAPAGFSAIAGNPSTTSQQWEHLFWRRADGMDSGTYDFTLSANAARKGVAVRLTGAIATGDPIDVSQRAQRASSATTTPAVSVTTTGPDRLLLWWATNYAGGTWTPPTDWTELVDSGEITAAVTYLSTAGSTGSIIGTGSTAGRQTAALVAIIPAPTGAPVPLRRRHRHLLIR